MKIRAYAFLIVFTKLPNNSRLPNDNNQSQRVTELQLSFRSFGDEGDHNSLTS